MLESLIHPVVSPTASVLFSLVISHSTDPPAPLEGTIEDHLDGASSVAGHSDGLEGDSHHSSFRFYMAPDDLRAAGAAAHPGSPEPASTYRGRSPPDGMRSPGAPGVGHVYDHVYCHEGEGDLIDRHVDRATVMASLRKPLKAASKRSIMVGFGVRVSLSTPCPITGYALRLHFFFGSRIRAYYVHLTPHS